MLSVNVKGGNLAGVKRKALECRELDWMVPLMICFAVLLLTFLHLSGSLGKEVHGAELGKALYFNKFRTISWVYFVLMSKEGTSRINWCGLWFPITLNWPPSQNLDTQYFLKPVSFKANGRIKPSEKKHLVLVPCPLEHLSLAVHCVC